MFLLLRLYLNVLDREPERVRESRRESWIEPVREPERVRERARESHRESLWLSVVLSLWLSLSLTLSLSFSPECSQNFAWLTRPLLDSQCHWCAGALYPGLSLGQSIVTFHPSTERPVL